MTNGARFMAISCLMCVVSGTGWLPPTGTALCLGLGVGLGVVGMRRAWAVFSYWRRCSRVCNMLKADFDQALGDDRMEDAEALHRRLGRVLEVWGASIRENREGGQDPEDL